MSLDTTLKLGFHINNGEALAIIKKEREFIQGHIDQMLRDKETKFSAMRDKINLLDAYDILIDRFEKHLGHED